ncbi:MAG: sugar transferase [Pseudomonadota bacterium]
MKRLFDILAASSGLLILSPLLLMMMFLVWLQDRHSPFYIANRIGKNGVPFKMVKLRSMVINADKSGVDSTASDDKRITTVGKFIRRFKLDELMQLWNVLLGDMSVVGPRPNVAADTARYTEEERELLTARPGITDIASIVFSDEGDILEGSQNPDLLYNQIIRPYKSRFAIIYVRNQTLSFDIFLILQTIIGIANKKQALMNLHRRLVKLNVDQNLLDVCLRQSSLKPAAPPGSDTVVQSL